MRRSYGHCSKCGKGILINLKKMGMYTVGNNSWDYDQFIKKIGVKCKKCQRKK